MQDELTPSAKLALESAVKQYSENIVGEAKRLQRRESYGQVPIEITASHIEAARQELEKLPRRPRNSKWIWLLKGIQILSPVGCGVGGSNLNTQWGVPLLIGSLVALLIVILIERELTR